MFKVNFKSKYQEKEVKSILANKKIYFAKGYPRVEQDKKGNITVRPHAYTEFIIPPKEKVWADIKIPSKFKEKDYEWVADKVLEGWSEGEAGLIKIASKQKKQMDSFDDIYRLARKQIIKELKMYPSKMEEEYSFFKEMEE